MAKFTKYTGLSGRTGTTETLGLTNIDGVASNPAVGFLVNNILSESGGNILQQDGISLLLLE